MYCAGYVQYYVYMVDTAYSVHHILILCIVCNVYNARYQVFGAELTWSHKGRYQIPGTTYLVSRYGEPCVVCTASQRNKLTRHTPSRGLHICIYLHITYIYIYIYIYVL